jgi:ribonucleoside-diphosphate reductase alpha chain
MDVINEFNPVPSVVMRTTNPCGEQPLAPYESCNLGSINLLNHMEGRKINWIKLERTTRNAVRALDLVVDINHYPLPENKEKTQANRKIGLGVMAVADMLYGMLIRYGTQEAINKCEEVMKFIDEIAQDESHRLALEKGCFPNWEISIYNDMGLPMRNASRTTIAPTGSIAILAGVSSGIEPNFLLAYDRTVRETHGEGSYKLRFVNPALVEVLKDRGLYSEELLDKIVANGGVLGGLEEIPEDIKYVFVTSFDITTEEHLLMQSAFQKYINNAVSKTINMPYSATPEDIGKVYIKAWELGLKGITVYRDGSLDSQVLNSTVEKKEEVELSEEEISILEVAKEQGLEVEACPECGKKSIVQGNGCSFCYNCGYSPCHNS